MPHPTSSSDEDEERSSASVEERRKIQDALSCAVCRDWLDDPVCLSCGHLLCRSCAVNAFHQQSACPTCRKAVSKRVASCATQVDLVNVVNAAKRYVEAFE